MCSAKVQVHSGDPSPATHKRALLPQASHYTMAKVKDVFFQFVCNRREARSLVLTLGRSPKGALIRLAGCVNAELNVDGPSPISVFAMHPVRYLHAPLGVFTSGDDKVTADGVRCGSVTTTKRARSPQPCTIKLLDLKIYKPCPSFENCEKSSRQSRKGIQ